jgi:hypothetical protein
METRARSNPACTVRFLERILSCRLTYHTRQPDLETSEYANRVVEDVRRLSQPRRDIKS